MFKICLLGILVVLIAGICYSDVVINEIMYNPAGNDYDFEYIELYGDGENISKWYFEGVDFSFPDNVSIDGYLVVANTLNDSGEDNDFLDRYPTVTCVFEYKGNLLNSGEILILVDKSGNIMDTISYSNSWGADGNNKSLCRLPDGDGIWQECENTPGVGNGISDIGSCDWKISVVINNSATDDPEWQIRASKLSGEGKANITIKHWIEDSYGNIAKNYADIKIKNALTRSTSSKYSPILTKGQGYFIKANITRISCIDKDSSNNFISKLIFVRSEQKSINSNSSINIKGASPDSVKFGGVVNVKMDVYRGDTSKYAVYAYIEDEEGNKISEKNTMHFRNKFTNYTLTVPIQLKPNCNERYGKGEYEIIVNGLDTEDKEEVYIEGITNSLCEEIEIEKKKSKGKLSYDIVEMPYTIYLNKSFNVFLKIENNYEDDVDLEVWSYVYRGNKKYSPEKENLKYVTIDEEDTKEVRLETKVLEGKEGDYKFKVKVRKKGRKTTYDKTKEVHLKVPEEILEKSQKVSLLTDKKDKVLQKEAKEEITGDVIREEGVIYESDTFFIKKLIPLFMVFLLLLAVGFALIGLKKR